MSSRAQFETYINALLSGQYTPIAKIDFLRSIDESIESTIIGEITDGTLNIERNNGVRRAVDITLTNIDKQFKPDK